ISGPSPVQGYWRVPYALPARGAAPTDYVGGPVEVLSGDLPAELERVTRLGLGTIAKVLTAPFDRTDGNLTRPQVTAAGIGSNGQLRADEQQLRRKTSGDALARLIKIIERQKKILGDDGAVSILPREQVEGEAGDCARGATEDVAVLGKPSGDPSKG